MKKIGLCVCYDTKNYGSQLQVLATLKKIEELGYDYEIIRYKKKFTPLFILQSLPRFANPYFLRSKLNGIKKRKTISKRPDIQKQVNIRNKRFAKFIKQYFSKLSVEYYGYRELVKGTEKYDGFLVGSDQLWLPNNMGSRFYNLLFVPDRYPKVAYATSFGVSQIPWYQKKSTKKYLNRFDKLSTREVRGSEIIKELTGKEVKVVCDPTLLFSAEEWLHIIPERRIIDQPYIYCYFLGNNPKHREIAVELKEKTGFKIITTPFLDNYVEVDELFGDHKLFDIGADDFVNLIRHADYVLTDSFHGSVFSILHHKQFITFNRFMSESKNSRNSRIESLCKLLSLEERRYETDICESINKPINYCEVDERLNKLRKESIEYLIEALKVI